jgi:hypothetical protein
MTRLRADDLRAAIAQRIGCQAGIADDQLLAALDAALTRRPDGTVLIDAEALTELRTQAEAGRNSRERALVDAALRQGKIIAAAADTWLTLLQHNPEAAATALAGLKPIVPVGQHGYGNDDSEADPDGRMLKELYPEL